MTYFKWASLILGGYTTIGILYVWLFSKNYLALVNKVMTDKRPMWVVLLFVAWSALTVYTWYRFLEFTNAAALVVSVVFTFGLVKLTLLVTHYEKMKILAIALLTEEKRALNVILSCFFALGLVLLYIGFKI